MPLEGTLLNYIWYFQSSQYISGQPYEPEEYVVPLPRSPSPSQKESPVKGKKSTVKDRGAPTPVEDTQVWRAAFYFF